MCPLAGKDDAIAEISHDQRELSLGNRALNLEKLADDNFDVLIVGGGITGCGIALDAASRGLKVALIESSDFSSGTSSRSSKLIHGGLRYLQHLEFTMVREAALERDILARLAPGLVNLLPFILPIYGGIRESIKYRAGLLAYDLVSGTNCNHRHKRLSNKELHGLSSFIRTESLRSAYEYTDAVTDDVRLTIQIAKVASSLGAIVANYTKFVAASRNGSGFNAAIVSDCLSGSEFTIKAKQIVMAGGVWTDELIRGAQIEHNLSITPSKGCHLLLRGDLIDTQKAFAMTAPSDGRLVFAIPWRGTLLVGTTDTLYEGDLSHPIVTREDAEYLLDTVNHQFPHAHVKYQDIISAQAGLRPLLAQEGKTLEGTSRKERILRLSDGLLAVGGGKLTTYRPIAARVVDAVLTAADGCKWRPSFTENIPLLRKISDQPMSSNTLSGTRPLSQLSATIDYGQSIGTFDISAKTHGPVTSTCFHSEAEISYCLNHEMVLTIEDFLARRTRTALLDPQNGTVAAKHVATTIGNYFKWSHKEQLSHVSRYLLFAKEHQVDMT